jgi:hypothetical protein
MDVHGFPVHGFPGIPPKILGFPDSPVHRFGALGVHRFPQIAVRGLLGVHGFYGFQDFLADLSKSLLVNAGFKVKLEILHTTIMQTRAVAVVFILGFAIAAIAYSKSDKENSLSSGIRSILLAKWSGPYGGVPPFNQISIELFKPAIEGAMAHNLAEVGKIAANPEAPTFQNTIAAMEHSGQELDRATKVYHVWANTMSSDGFRAIEREMAPKLAEFRDTVMQNARLFERIEKVYSARENTRLSPEQKRLVWDYYTDFVREGAKLSPEQKAKVAAINKRLANLYTQFRNNLLHDEENYVLYLTQDQVGGIPQSQVKAMAEAAAQRGQQGKYAVLNTRSSMEPFLTRSGY